MNKFIETTMYGGTEKILINLSMATMIKPCEKKPEKACEISLTTNQKIAINCSYAEISTLLKPKKYQD